MKKVFFICAVLFTTFLANAQKSGNLVTDFINSPDNAPFASFIAGYGEISTDECNIKYVDDNTSKPTLNIVIRKNKALTAIIEVVAIDKKFDNFLPRNSHYAAQLVDYTNYDIATKSGTIKTFDLNYDFYLSATIDVKNTDISSFVSHPMPDDIKSKYSSLKKVNEIQTESGTASKTHFCDKNQNGNLGFGECMGCMQNACNGSPSCATMCWIVNVAGIGTSIGGQCSISMGAACLYLSIMY
jgi:hypothetical protein